MLQSDALYAQYARIKASVPDVLVLLHVGDFYESFDDDADCLARVLGLARTVCAGRSIAGFPHFYLEHHLSQLIAAGRRVAVAEPPPGDTILNNYTLALRA